MRPRLIVPTVLALGLFVGCHRKAVPISYSGENPSELAWRVLAENSHAALGGNGRLAWEFWPSRDNVVLEYPKTPTCAPESESSLVVSGETLLLRIDKLARSGLATTPDATDKTEEIKYNFTLCGSIKERDVFSSAGRVRAFERREDVAFVDGSMAIKADWCALDGDTSVDDGLLKLSHVNAQDFHCEAIGRQTYCLLAFHAAFKDAKFPNWFWATWEHRALVAYAPKPGDTDPGPGMCCHDSFGFTSKGAPTRQLLDLLSRTGTGEVLTNYRLVGTQASYEEDGLPTLLGNRAFESGFANASSCMTCHSRATTNDSFESLTFFICPDPDSGHKHPGCPDAKSGTPYAPVGVPLEHWFFDGNKRTFTQVGFMWGLMKTANLECPMPTP